MSVTRRVPASIAWAVALWASAVAFGSCAQGLDVNPGGTLALSLADGHPVFVTGTAQLHFDWSGRLRRVDAAGSSPVSGTVTVSADTAVEQPWAASLVAAGAEVMHRASLPAQEVPPGWRPLGVVTVAEGTAGRKSNGAAPAFHAYCVDTRTSQLLAELDLTEMFASLYGLPKENLSRAAVHQANLGPAGGMGLAVSFTHSGSHVWEVGVWHDDRWTPLALPQGTYQPLALAVGPEDRSIVYCSGAGTSELRFFDGKGTLLASVITAPRQLETLLTAWRMRTLMLIAAVAGGALAAVALLALLWWFVPALWPRRGLESRRGGTQ